MGGEKPPFFPAKTRVIWDPDILSLKWTQGCIYKDFVHSQYCVHLYLSDIWNIQYLICIHCTSKPYMNMILFRIYIYIHMIRAATSFFKVTLWYFQVNYSSRSPIDTKKVTAWRTWWYLYAFTTSFKIDRASAITILLDFMMQIKTGRVAEVWVKKPWLFELYIYTVIYL